VGAETLARRRSALRASRSPRAAEPNSDIDLFVVRPASVSPEDRQWRTQLESMARDVIRWTGNHAGMSEIGEDELGGLAAKRPPVVEDPERDAVTVPGPDARRVLNAASESIPPSE
jgi:hypothetical protein